jgi:hypothetical protein
MVSSSQMENFSTQRHQTRIFGLTLGALLAMSLLLSAASWSNQGCRDHHVEFGTIDADFSPPDQALLSLAVRNASYSRSSANERVTECAAGATGEEPGY